MDQKTHALIGPEPVVDPAEAAALERRVQREDDELQLRIAYYAIPLAAGFFVAFLFLLQPVFTWLGRPGQLLLWILVNIPLLAFVRRAWREARFPMGFGHAFEGYKARTLALALFLLSLATFLEAGLAEELWQWIATPGW